jgi:hypothetical protein
MKARVPGSRMMDRQLALILVVAAVAFSGQSVAMAQPERKVFRIGAVSAGVLEPLLTGWRSPSG